MVQSRFEERLRCNCREIASTATTGQARRASTVLPDHLAVSLRKRLPALGQHVGNGVDVDGLIFMGEMSTDVAKFHRYSAVDLPLHGQAILLAHAGAEIGIQSFSGAS